MSFLKKLKSYGISGILLTLVLLLTACENMPSRNKIPILRNIGNSAVDADTKPLDEDVFFTGEENLSDVSSQNIKETNSNYIRIGVLLPLTGNASKIGLALRNAALMAQYEVALDNIILQFYDTAGTPEQAVEATKEAINHGVKLIIGPVFSASVTPVAKLANRKGINVITFSNDPYVVGDGVYTIGLLLNQQVEKILSYAKQNNYAKLAIIAPDNDTGLTIANSAAQVASNAGIEVYKTSYYDPSINDFSQVVKEISDYDLRVQNLEEQKKLLEGLEDEVSKAALEKLEQVDTLGDVEFDMILLAEGGSKLRSLASMLPYYDVLPSKVKFLGTSLWDDSSLIRESSLQGGWYTALPKEASEAFQARYENYFKTKAPRVASLAYDAVALASAIARGKDDTDFSKEELTNPNGFAGIDGIFRLLPSGYSERGLAIVEINKKGSIIVEPAPDSFVPDINNDDLFIQDNENDSEIKTQIVE
ncbi:MAG: penicillin-binding protein activator [Alphaproteobacteria bacterium]